MGKTISGFTEETTQNLLLDTGAFYVNFEIDTDTLETASTKLLGATSGGGNFEAKPNFRDIKVDGVKGKAKGLKILESWSVTMGASLLELKKEVLQKALAVTTTTTTTVNTKNYSKIEGKNVIENTDYIDNITWIGSLSGSGEPVIIQVFNCLNTEGLKLNPKDSEDIVAELNFEGHYSVDNLDNPPFAIYYPTIV
ncbi:hypothetical protein KQI86_16700 [Clostridium sp. MSJ-11]|uniref:Phage tail protein n=1 Tax=Clostridium mobile TaxID=2841512 RepID=A0ABS6EMI0_9CLOT|nr:hypothetical protein [Clostridium mobile]MBU5485962.1 hypothetical protein [Clostridium mobile]